jgi:hypothetical protein
MGSSPGVHRRLSRPSPGIAAGDRYRIAEAKHSYDLEYQLPTEAP